MARTKHVLDKNNNIVLSKADAKDARKERKAKKDNKIPVIKTITKKTDVEPPKKQIKHTQKYNITKEIKNCQEKVNNIIPKSPFRRLTREVAQDLTMRQGKKDTEMRWTQDGLDALQAASEDYLVNYFEILDSIAFNAKRTTIKRKDCLSYIRLGLQYMKDNKMLHDMNENIFAPYVQQYNNLEKKKRLLRKKSFKNTVQKKKTSKEIATNKSSSDINHKKSTDSKKQNESNHDDQSAEEDTTETTSK